MYKNIFLKTLTDYLRSILIWGVCLGVLMLFLTLTYSDIMHGPNRAKQVADSYRLAESGALPGGKAYDLDTFGGFITFRFLALIPVIIAIFTLLMGSGLTRGEEEKGITDLLMSTPHSRRAVLLQKWAALMVATMGIAAFTAAGTLIGANIIGADLEFVAVILAYLNYGLCAMVFGSLAMLLGQLTLTRKAAAGWTGALVAATVQLDTLADQISALGWLHYISPFYYCYQSKPLARSVGMNWPIMGVLLALSLVALAAASWLYERRDHSNVYPLFGKGKANTIKNPYRVAKPRVPWLANSFVFALRSALPGAVYWSVIPSLYLFIIVRSFDNLKDEILNLMKQDIYKSFGYAPIATNENLLALPVAFTTLINCIYAITLVAGWAGDETHGRLEMLLSTPQPRWRLLIGRFTAASLAMALMNGLVWASFSLTALASAVKVDIGLAAGAFFAAWVVSVIVVAAGFALSAFSPTIAVAVLGGLVMASYMLDAFGNLFTLPEWFVRLSVFREYGRPMVDGLNWTAMLALLAISVAFIALAIWRFGQRDTLKTL